MTAHRALAAALTAAVEVAADAAAGAPDRPAYDEAVGRLVALDAARVSSVTAAVVRGLVEERHPGGLTGQDAAALLRRVAAAGAWLPDLDPSVLLVVVTGALGLLDVDDQPEALSPEVVLRHAPVLLAVLLGSAPLAPRVDAALAELRRAETVELP